VWAEAFAGATRVLYWPFALPSERIPGASSWLRDALRDLSIDVDLNTWEDLAGHHADELSHFDLLFVGGGTTSKLASHIEEHRFGDAVRGFLAAGGTYYGGSAGAVLSCAEITLASQVEDDPQSAGMPGLGLVQGISVFPHSDKYPSTRARDLADSFGHDILALPEAAGVAIVDHTVRAIGPDIVRLVAPGGITRTLRGGESASLRAA
jgi:dipeptidase E